MALDYVTIVLSAPATTNLVTLTAVKLELELTNTSNDTWLQTKIVNMSAAVEDYCNRTFGVQTVQDTIYFQNSPFLGQLREGVQPLQLSTWPIVSVISVMLDEVGTIVTLTAGVAYIIDARKGQLIRLRESTTFPKPWRSVPTTVQYQAGYPVVPSPVVEATLKMITKAWWKRGQDPTLKMREQESGREEYWISNRPAEGDMTPDIQDLLDNYRMPVMA